MAYWDRISSRGSIDDRRGDGIMALGGGGIGLVGIAVVLLMNFLSGGSVDMGSVLNGLQTAPSQSNTGAFEGVDDYEEFASTVLGSANDTWREIFTKSNRQYQEPRLVLFRSATQSACGFASSQVGPFYCPADSTVYIDETFFDVLEQRFGASGDVAEAYVIAHEVGHHAQNQLGIMDRVNLGSNEQSVKLELQADCFAGIWANSVADLGVFEPGEIKEALDAAAAVGDDRIQGSLGGSVNPESWTHGSSEQRTTWFTRGYESGNPSVCNTFD
jgi:predicted metalloprotease